MVKLSRPLYGWVKELKFPKNLDFSVLSPEEISLLYQINGVIVNSLDFSIVSKGIVDFIREKLNFTLGTLFVFNHQKGIGYPIKISSSLMVKLEKIFGKVLEEHIGVISKNDNLVVKCARSKKAYIGNDLRDFVSPVLSEKKTLFIQKLLKIRLGILFPLIIDDKVLGAFLITSSRDESSKKEEIILGFLKEQMTIILHNILAHQKTQFQLQQIQRQYQELQAIHAINNSIANVVNFDLLAQKSIDALVGSLGFKLCFLFLVNHENSELYLFKMSCKTGREKKFIQILMQIRGDLYNWQESLNKPSGNFISRCATTGKLFIGTDLNEFIYPLISKGMLRINQFLFGTKSYMCGPITVKNKIEGVVFVSLDASEEEIRARKDTFIACINQIGLALENTQLYQQLRKQVSLLQEATSAYSELEKLDRAKTEFLSIVSHQLRTPLTSIRGNVFELQEQSKRDLTPEQIETMRTILSSTERLSLVVEDVLGVSQIESGKMSINKASEDILATFVEAMERPEEIAAYNGLQFTFTKKHRKVILPHDEQKMRQCFVNLLDNAVSYTLKGEIAVTLVKSPTTCTITIQDTGIGIPEEFQSQMYKKFSRAENAKQVRPDGTGIGLFLTKTFIEAHGGSIEIESPVRLGKRKNTPGTKVTIKLPMVIH